MMIDPDCNAIGPNYLNCKDLNPTCIDLKYIAGPLSADPAGVNNKRYDKTSEDLKCTLNIQQFPKCINVRPYEDKGKCKEVMVKGEQ